MRRFPGQRTAPRRCSDQRAWVANVVFLDRHRPPNRPAYRLSRWAVRGVPRERATAHHEQIRNVSRPRVFFDDAYRRIAAHHGAPDVVRALASRDTEARAHVLVAQTRTVERGRCRCGAYSNSSSCADRCHASRRSCEAAASRKRLCRSGPDRGSCADGSAKRRVYGSP